MEYGQELVHPGKEAFEREIPLICMERTCNSHMTSSGHDMEVSARYCKARTVWYRGSVYRNNHTVLMAQEFGNDPWHHWVGPEHSRIAAANDAPRPAA